LTALAVLAWLAFACCAVVSLVAISRAKTLASAHLTATLGFPVRRAAFSTPQGWRAFIERERRYHEQGYRPKFSISIGNPPGRRR
jgi:hypothetical protein